jgi:hypothetical protein
VQRPNIGIVVKRASWSNLVMKNLHACCPLCPEIPQGVGVSTSPFDFPCDRRFSRAYVT